MVTARHGVAAPLPAFSASDNVALLPACSAEGTASLAGTGTYPCVSLEDAGKDIIGHAPTNDGSQHVCTVCHDTFDDRSNYLRHYMRHTGEQPFTCTQCPHQCSRKGNLQTHLKNVHCMTVKAKDIPNPPSPSQRSSLTTALGSKNKAQKGKPRRSSKPTVLEAAAAGDIETARRILRRKKTEKTKNASMAVHDADGCTPLLLACKHGHLNLVKLYLVHGASYDDRDRDPKRQGNALHYASWGGHARIVNFLVEQGASLDDVDIVGNTALLYAAHGGHRQLVAELVARGRSLQERNSKNHTALLAAACGGHLPLVRWLLQQGFALDGADHDGNTALLFAAWGGHIDLVHFLLAHGSSLTERNNSGLSIFLSAANGGRVEIVEWLLTQGFSLTDTNSKGDTALLLAAYGRHCHLVERLLDGPTKRPGQHPHGTGRAMKRLRVAPDSVDVRRSPPPAAVTTVEPSALESTPHQGVASLADVTSFQVAPESADVQRLLSAPRIP